MADISAADVKELRVSTGLPMMDCKKALTECDGDKEAAVKWLRERGAKVFEKRADRVTAFGRFGMHVGVDNATSAMVELKCESAPVSQNEEFIQLANDLATALANSDGIDSADALLELDSPSQPGTSLGAQKDELFNRIREVFNVGRFVKIDGGCGGYSHNAGTVSGVILAVDGGDDESARDICMHVAAMRPAVLSVEDLPQNEVNAERETLRNAALAEGKPENIVDKMVEGRLRNYFAERVLSEQAFVKDDSMTVGKFAESKGMSLKQYVHWEISDDGGSSEEG